MGSLTLRRAWALLASTALLLAGLAAPVSAAPPCTDFVDGTYTTPVVKGMVVCGTGLYNAVDVLDGGIFIGGADAEENTVVEMHAGKFLGGPGWDQVVYMYGGTFRGGDGVDLIHGEMHGGRFFGQAGDDYALLLRGGTFMGGGGDDEVTWHVGGVFNGGTGDDEVTGCAGPDAIQRNVEDVTSIVCTS